MRGLTKNALNKAINHVNTQHLIGAGLLLMLVILGYGFSHNPQSYHTTFIQGGTQSWLLFTLVFWGACTGLYFTKVKRFIHIVAIFCIALVTVPTVGLGTWAVVIFFLISAFACGEAVCRRFFSFEAKGLLQITLALLIGLAVYVTCMNVLVHYPVNYSVTYLCLLGIPIILNRYATYRLLAHIYAYREPIGWQNFWEYSAFNLILYLLLIHFLHATQPEQMFDALSMHLAISHQVSVNHLWDFDFINHIWAVMPMNGDWLYTIAYVLGGEFAARFSDMAMLCLLVVMIVGVVKQFLGRGLSYLMGALFLSSPLVHLESSSLFIENVWAVFSLGAVVAFLHYRSGKKTGYLYATMILLGAALATKMIAVFLVVIMGFLIAIDLLKQRSASGALKVLLISMVIIFCVGSIPYVNAYLLTGNPMFPFYNAIFQSPYLDIHWSFDQPHFKQGMSFGMLYDMTFHSDRYAEAMVGVPGYQYLLFLPLALIALIKKPRRDVVIMLAIAVLFVAFVFQFQSYLRYIYPVFPLFSIAIAYLFSMRWGASQFLSRMLVSTATAVVFLNVFAMPGAAGAYRDFPIKKAFLGQHTLIPSQKVLEYLNLTCGTHCRVGILSGGVIADLDGKAFTHNWHTWNFTVKVRTASDLASVEKVIKEYKLNYLVIREGDTNINDAMHQFIAKYAHREFSAQSMSAYKIITKSMQEEVLVNHDFHEGVSGWSVAGKVAYDKSGHSVKISNKNYLTQVIPAKAGTSFRTTITARCDAKNAYVRLQANWLNNKGEFLSATLFPEHCGGTYKQFSEQMLAPPDATQAIVYLIAHGAYEIDVKEISFASY